LKLQDYAVEQEGGFLQMAASIFDKLAAQEKPGETLGAPVHDPDEVAKFAAIVSQGNAERVFDQIAGKARTVPIPPARHLAPRCLIRNLCQFLKARHLARQLEHRTK
jgi:hypothetical protein